MPHTSNNGSPLLLFPGPASISPSFTSKHPPRGMSVTGLSFSSPSSHHHFIPAFLQNVTSSQTADSDHANSYSIDMAASHPVQSELHPLHTYFERWQALKQYSDSKDNLIQVRETSFSIPRRRYCAPSTAAPVFLLAVSGT